MRTFADDQGDLWEVTIGRESWGTFVLLFTRPDGGKARTSVLSGESMLAAQDELDALSEQELRGHLAASRPWGED